MLHEFITIYRDAIIERTREKLRKRPWPHATTAELAHGVPLFLTQLSEKLAAESSALTCSPDVTPDAIGLSAARHGGELLALGFNVSEVVHAYGDICRP